MKTFALSVALGASLVSSAAMADQRPTYLAFAAPAAAPANTIVGPATPKVVKRDSAIGNVPLFVPLLAAFAIIGGIIGVATGGGNGNGNGSPG